MLSKIPIILESVGKEDTDKEILRTAIMAELGEIGLRNGTCVEGRFVNGNDEA